MNTNNNRLRTEKQLSFDDIKISNDGAADDTVAAKEISVQPEELRKKKRSSNVKTIIYLIIVICVPLLMIGGYAYTHISEDVYNKAYDKGYSQGFVDGRTEGYLQGYDDGQDDSMPGFSSNDISYGRIAVTSTGEKYHQVWCQYVSNKTNLFYYETAADAEAAGYDACSVCN